MEEEILNEGYYYGFLNLPFSLICHSLLLMKRERARHGVQLLKCVPASTVDCVWSQKRVIRPTQTSNLSTWDAHVREDTREDSVIAKLTPASSMVSRVTQA